MPSKLGLHSLSTRDELIQYVRNGGRLVKLVSDFPAKVLLDINPDLLIVGRAYDALTAQEQFYGGESAKVSARRYVDMQRPIYELNPLVRYWEGHNEPSWGGPGDSDALAGMKWYGEFEAERVSLLAGMGLRAVVGNFATGYPEVQNDNSLWEAFLPALRAAHEHRGMLGVHEYGGPFMWSLYGPYVANNCGHHPIGEPENSEGWLCLRYRKIHRHILKPNGLEHLPIVVTENGTDRVGTFCEPWVSGAWRDLIGAWQGWNGSTDPIDYWRGSERDPERYFAEQLFWYDREMQKDPYCVGSTIFTIGSYGPPWSDFDIAGSRVAQHLLSHVKNNPWTGPHDPWLTTPTEPTPVPEPTPSPGGFVVTNPGEAIVAGLKLRDAASIADLYNQNAILVSPTRTVVGRKDIRRFYASVIEARSDYTPRLHSSRKIGSHWVFDWTDGHRRYQDSVLLFRGKIQRHDTDLSGTLIDL